jgi:hypothetical protein
MRYWKVIVLAPAIILAAACGRKDNKVAADSSLNRDLNLANQVSPNRLDTISPTEAGYVGGAAGTRTATRSAGTTPARRTTTRRRSSGGTVSSSGGNVASSSGGQTVTEKHTRRDAAIGAAAGAVIGATTSRDKVKGAVIGGVIGGVLGGVIGNNVDVKKRKPPQE